MQNAVGTERPAGGSPAPRGALRSHPAALRLHAAAAPGQRPDPVPAAARRVANGYHGAMMPRLAVALGGLLALGSAVRSQVQWTLQPVLSGQGCPTAYDAARAQAVAFTGLGETYVSTAAGWIRLQPAASPSRRCGHALAYDSLRQRVVLFGGHNEYPPYEDHDDTWEWDGATWLQRTTTVRPSVRWGQGMVYDVARGRCVLFGGCHTANLDDTWEWDGSTWIQRSPANRPSARYFLGMAYDSVRQVTVLFGGTDGGSGTLGDTWEWNGSNWTQRLPVVSPPVRFAHGMTFDTLRNRTVIFGGDPAVSGAPCRDDTWEWDGVAWSQRAVATVPPARYRPGFVFDAAQGRVTMFSGNSGSPDFAGLTDEWALDAVGWTQVRPHRVPVRGSLAYDTVRHRVVCHGGYMSGTTPLAATWEWDGATWTRRLPPVSPPPRVRSAVAYDRARGRLVMFGGVVGAGAALADTWEWDGATWLQRLPASGPPGRENHAMVYDAARAKVVMYGGVGAAGPLFDTWQWDGSVWTTVATPVRPNAFGAHGMAYDTARQRVVLFGGVNVLAQPLAETWEWDGVAWVQRTPAHAPSPRYFPRMAYDAARGRTVLYGIGDFTQELLDTWEWDGSDWLQRSPTDMPRPLLGSSMAYDSDREVVVVFANQTWEYRSSSHASVSSLGGGCAGSAGVPSLHASGSSRPWLGDVFTVGVGNVSTPLLGLIAVGFTSGSLDLTPLGMPGCVLLPSLDGLFTLTANGTFALAIPNHGALLGVQLTDQAAVFEPTANPFGFVLSNGVVATIGAR